MENIRKYNVREHYLLEIDDVFNGPNNGRIYKTWSWDVYIADNGYEYKGMAIERTKNEIIPWTTLVEHEYEIEMNKLCQERVSQRV
ncbi:hypothetical protein [Peribacillus frigoritolerans]|uniref:hypothetical protein n=1 Tax=Peribacillus frigoritolerans TaxID=450367 RepID=UPI002E2113E0|nr:hypothetical protein [Peribacillus frigoritolerans]MED3845717.1 hypothetical protein [Peribacillus frigoritolerans]